VPIILGMVLGGIAEEKFRAGLARVDTVWDFINRPIAAAIFTVILVALVIHFVALARARVDRRVTTGR